MATEEMNGKSVISGSRENIREFSHIIKYLYENFEMLSRWTPEFTAKELLLLLALKGDRLHRISDIAHETGFSISTVSWLVDSLVKNKCVIRRRQSSDRRVVTVKLAPKGQDAIREYDRIFEKMAETFYETLTFKEQKEFLRLTRKVIGKLEKSMGKLMTVQTGEIRD